MRIVPRAGAPALEVTVSRRARLGVAVFLGRRKIAGHVAGAAHLLSSGIAGRDGKRVHDLQPASTSCLSVAEPGRLLAAGEDPADLVLGVRGHHRQHLVAGLEDGVAPRHHDVLVAHDGDDRGVARDVDRRVIALSTTGESSASVTSTSRA